MIAPFAHSPYACLQVLPSVAFAIGLLVVSTLLLHKSIHLQELITTAPLVTAPIPQVTALIPQVAAPIPQVGVVCFRFKTMASQLVNTIIYLRIPKTKRNER